VSALQNQQLLPQAEILGDQPHPGPKRRRNRPDQKANHPCPRLRSVIAEGPNLSIVNHEAHGQPFCAPQGLTDAAIEWWGKAGEQALRRSAFQEAISHLGKAIEMADKTGEGTSTAPTASASANRRLKIQTDLGKALMFSRGFGAEELKAAFIRARELAAAIDNPIERFTAPHMSHPSEASIRPNDHPRAAAAPFHL
jgi:hypothetical protein